MISGTKRNHHGLQAQMRPGTPQSPAAAFEAATRHCHPAEYQARSCGPWRPKKGRRWKSSRFASLPSRTLIEIEGGIYVHGRHNRGAGFAADLEKYLEATLGGWRVVRLGPNELTATHVERLIALVSEPGGHDSPEV